jgi:alcohol dehydrogenase class IV
MAWVSTCGGLALANAGLGAIHGFAGVIGGQTNAPHGEICGTLLPAVLESHLQKAEKDTDIHERISWVRRQIDTHFAMGRQNCGIAELRKWSATLGLRSLEGLGLSCDNYDEVANAAAKASSMKGNPFPLTHMDLLAILRTAS